MKYACSSVVAPDLRGRTAATTCCRSPEVVRSRWLLTCVHRFVMQNRNGKYIWTRLPSRFRHGLLVASATLLIGWTAAWSQPPPPNRSPVSLDEAAPKSTPEKAGKERLREGTELPDARGYFRFVDDRVVFFRSDGDGRFIGLENLNLERIVSEITNNPTQLEWTVFGTITEYRGVNYLMVRRAVLSRSTSDFSSPAAPSSSNERLGAAAHP